MYWRVMTIARQPCIIDQSDSKKGFTKGVIRFRKWKKDRRNVSKGQTFVCFSQETDLKTKAFACF